MHDDDDDGVGDTRATPDPIDVHNKDEGEELEVGPKMIKALEQTVAKSLLVIPKPPTIPIEVEEKG